mmetsp:Transcript_22407/g.34546  ORF Transcript_22407/g.34546 Transcript_22407/m.34546 type:complete len:181 (-) Transcript_22407:234-776(-)
MLDTSIFKPKRTSKNFTDDESNHRSKSLPATGLFDYALELQCFLKQNVVDDCGFDYTKNDVETTEQLSFHNNNEEEDDNHETENHQTGNHIHNHNDEEFSSSWTCELCTFQNSTQETITYDVQPYLTCLMCGHDQEIDDNLQELEEEYYQSLISLQEERMKDFQHISISYPFVLTAQLQL